jgi:hypothetical protein
VERRVVAAGVNMSRSYVIARCVLVILGVRVLVAALDCLYLPFMGQEGPSAGGVITGSLTLAILFAAAVYLLFYGQRVGGWFEDTGQSSQIEPLYAVLALRAVMILCGLLILHEPVDLFWSWGIKAILGLKALAEAYIYGYSNMAFDRSATEWASIAGQLGKAIVGIYLVFNTRYLLRRQCLGYGISAGRVDVEM